MKHLDITALSKAACRADDWRGVSFALFVGGGFLSAAVIAEHIGEGLAMVPVAFICILWLNMRLAWAKHRHAVDMLAVAQKIAMLGGDDEEEPAVPEMSVHVGEGKSGIVKKMLEDEGYVMSSKCECVSPDFVILPDDFDGRCAKCGKRMRRFVWLDLEESE